MATSLPPPLLAFPTNSPFLHYQRAASRAYAAPCVCACVHLLVRRVGCCACRSTMPRRCSGQDYSIAVRPSPAAPQLRKLPYLCPAQPAAKPTHLHPLMWRRGESKVGWEPRERSGGIKCELGNLVHTSLPKSMCCCCYALPSNDDDKAAEGEARPCGCPSIVSDRLLGSVSTSTTSSSPSALPKAACVLDGTSKTPGMSESDAAGPPSISLTA